MVARLVVRGRGVAATRLVLILRLLLLAFEERVDVDHLQLPHAVRLCDDGIHLLRVWLQGLHQSRMGACWAGAGQKWRNLWVLASNGDMQICCVGAGPQIESSVRILASNGDMGASG